MAASIRSWIKDRLTRFEAKNKTSLEYQPGADVQVERWLTYESPFWARVSDKEHSIVVRVSDEAAEKFALTFEASCTSLLRGVISISPCQPMIARMTPSSRPQLVLDVKAFNTKTIGSSESLFYPDTAFVESEEWAQEWAGRIFEVHPELGETVILPTAEKAPQQYQVSAVETVEQMMALEQRVEEVEEVDHLELGWCVIDDKQLQELRHMYPDPPVPAKYEHLFPSTAPRALPTPQTASAPARLEEEVAEESDDDEILIKDLFTLKGHKPASSTSANVAQDGPSAHLPPPPLPSEAPVEDQQPPRPNRRERSPSSSPAPDHGSSQSRTVTHSSPSHHSHSQSQDGPRPVKRIRLETADSKVLVLASDSDNHSQEESRVASELPGGGVDRGSHSGGSGSGGQPTSSAVESGGQATTDESSRHHFVTLTEPPFTLAQHVRPPESSIPSVESRVNPPSNTAQSTTDSSTSSIQTQLLATLEESSFRGSSIQPTMTQDVISGGEDVEMRDDEEVDSDLRSSALAHLAEEEDQIAVHAQVSVVDGVLMEEEALESVVDDSQVVPREEDVIELQHAAVDQAEEEDAQKAATGEAEAVVEVSLSVSQMPLPPPPPPVFQESSPDAVSEPVVAEVAPSVVPPPAPALAAPALPPPPPPPPSSAAAFASTVAVKSEVVDLRSASPEITIIESSSSVRVPNGPAPATVPASAPAPPPQHASFVPGTAPPPVRPPSPPPLPVVVARPSFTLSRTMDLPLHHGLPMYDDVVDILKRAQHYQTVMRQ